MGTAVTLHVQTIGHGPTVLLIHGAAEGADLLTPQAEAIAARGFRVIWYDRRGTAKSHRDDWPGSGADQHADDAAAVLREFRAERATVLGFSSGAVVALALAARHPDVPHEVIAWEPAAVAMIPDGPAIHAAIMEPIERYLAAEPDDWTGAYHDDPLVVRMARNAEAALRDDARLITTRVFRPGELAARLVTLAVSTTPDPLHLAVAERFAELVGRPVCRVPGADDHEVYLRRPDILADWLARR
jgi:pimeloyl-ACP methyl ester carboxylesterase